MPGLRRPAPARLWLAPLLAALAACAGAPSRPAAPALPAASIAQIHALSTAQELLGAPYRYGGSDPAGFDCSGLVQYSYASAGVVLPRTSRAQQGAVQPIPAEALVPGDLVFFQLGDGVSHVGIYAGEGVFIHAPSRSGRVMRSRLDDPYWAARWDGAGRMTPP